MQDIYLTFEFAKIKDFILEYSKTELGKKYVLDMKFSSNKEEITHNLNLLNEMMELISRYNPLTIQNSVDALRLIDIAKKTAILTPQDLNFIANDIDTSIKLANQIKKIEGEFPLICELCSHFTDLTSLNKEIKRVRGLGQAREFDRNIIIDNKKLDGFIKFFVDNKCSGNCKSCGYCKKISKKTITKNSEV